MTGIEYLDFYTASDDMDAYDVLKTSKSPKVQNDDYCNFFIQQNKLKKISVEKKRNAIDIIHTLFERLKEKNKIALDEVDYIFFCKNPYGLQFQDVHLPYYIVEKYQMVNATVINMFQECSTSLQAIEFADSLIKMKKAKKVMIVTLCLADNEEYERFIETSILGDGAGIMVISEENIEYEVEASHSVSNGIYSVNTFEGKKYSPMTTIQKTAIFMKEFLADNLLATQNLHYIVPQNLSYSNIHLLSKYIDTDIEKFYLKNLENGGHMADVDTVRNLLSITQECELAQNERVVLYSIGNIRPGMDFVFNVLLLRKI